MLIKRLNNIQIMIVILSSTNPQFSFLIGKNPANGPIMRSLRSGFIIGWFDNPSKYIIYFTDSAEICSFQQTEEESKYINVGQYSSPLIITGIISEILSNTVKKVDSDPYQNSIYISGLRITNIKLFQTIRDVFPNVNFEYQHLVGFMYELTLSSNGTLFDLMNIVSLMAILMALGNKESVTLDSGVIEKYSRHISQVTTGKVAADGWYLRYIFKKRAKIPRKQLFLLETSRIKMTYGNTSDARADFILSNLSDYNTDFVDIGCGSDLLIKHLIEKKWKQNHNYYLVDSDPKVQGKLQSKGLACYNSLTEFYEHHPDFNGNVIMNEVIEHNEEMEAMTIIHQILSHNPKTVFITTPNFDFNKFFNHDGFRHDDHHWEMTYNQFEQFISDIVADYSYEMNVMGIGDSIDNIPITSGAILIAK